MNTIKQLELLAKRGRKKKTGDPSRSRLLKIVMPFISGDHGKALAAALEKNDFNSFGNLWVTSSRKILTKVKELANTQMVTSGFKKSSSVRRGGKTPTLPVLTPLPADTSKTIDQAFDHTNEKELRLTLDDGAWEIKEFRKGVRYQSSYLGKIDESKARAEFETWVKSNPNYKRKATAGPKGKRFQMKLKKPSSR